MRVRAPVRLLAAALLGLALTAPAAGAGEAPPPDGTPIDQQWAEDFEAEVQQLIDEAGLEGDPAGLVGEPGDLDLPPGELTLVGIVQVAEGVDAETGGGSELAGPCQGVAISFDGDGGVVDAAADLDDGAAPVDLLDQSQAFTADNPFEVDVNGYVAYAGRADPAPIDHTWQIRTQGLSFDSGGDDNPDAENRNAGVVDLASDLPGPAKVNALFKIDGEMDAADGFRCQGSGYFRTVGGVPVLAGAGVVLVLAAGFGALFNARPARTWRA